MEDGILEQLTVHSKDISGDGDRNRLEGALSGIDGVRDVEVDPAQHSLQVTYDSTIVDAGAIRGAVEGAGYSLGSSSETTEGNVASSGVSSTDDRP